MTDLLFRRRGADIGVRAPGWVVRVAGAVLAVGIIQLAAALGVFTTLGVSLTSARLVALLIGAAIAPSAVGVWLWLVAALATGLLLVVSYTPLVAPLVPTLIRRDAAIATMPPDAVVVMSGSITSDGRVTGAALDRLLSGMAEAKRRRVPDLALSVVTNPRDPRGASSERDQRELVAMFAPELTLRMVRDVASTRDEALAFAALARTHGWRRVLLVTSPTHTRRACAALEVTGLQVECRPSVPRDYAVTRLDRPDNRRLAFGDVLYETAATLWYRSRGWLP